jgi:lipid-A-disaccharide synthase-like uncharacterized protein
MVEYAVLLAHNAGNIFGLAANDVAAWTAELDWAKVGYVALVLFFFRIVIWAFKLRPR